MTTANGTVLVDGKDMAMYNNKYNDKYTTLFHLSKYKKVSPRDLMSHKEM